MKALGNPLSDNITLKIPKMDSHVAQLGRKEAKEQYPKVFYRKASLHQKSFDPSYERPLVIQN